jgi:hypothetical protein
MRSFTVLAATLLAVGMVGGCGDDTPATPTATDTETTKENPGREQVDDLETAVSAARCFVRLGLKPPGDLRKRVRHRDFQIDLPEDLSGNRRVSSKKQNRLRDCLVSKVSVCTTKKRGHSTDFECEDPPLVGIQTRP